MYIVEIIYNDESRSYTPMNTYCKAVDLAKSKYNPQKVSSVIVLYNKHIIYEHSVGNCERFWRG